MVLHFWNGVGQQSLADPTRAPEGRQTLWAYSRVPSSLEGGWAASKEAFADRVEKRIEELAPGFRRRILARAIFAPPDLQAMNENLIGGDLGGGSADIRHQLFFRPVFPYFRYRTPVRALYLVRALEGRGHAAMEPIRQLGEQLAAQTFASGNVASLLREARARREWSALLTPPDDPVGRQDAIDRLADELAYALPAS